MANAQPSGFQLSWQNLIMSVGLVFVLVGGFWTLAYIPIKQKQEQFEADIRELRSTDNRITGVLDLRYLTLREHAEFKEQQKDALARIAGVVAEIRREMERQRNESLSRSDMQQLLNTTRLEFLSEIKRLDQANAGNMKRQEFDSWKSERDKSLVYLQDRQNRFSEALDSMYSKILQHIPSYAPR